MQQSKSEKAQGLDGLVIACLIVSSILVISVLSGTSFLASIGVITVSLIVLFLYLRPDQTQEEPLSPRLTEQDISTLRAETLEDVADALPRAIAVLDKMGEVIYANQAAKDLLSPDMVDRPVGAYLRSSELRPALKRAFDGEDTTALSIHVLQPTERIVDVDLSKPVSIQSGPQSRDIVFAVIADRTEAMLAREKRADFLANASHELKTPIASLKGYIETLRGHAKDDPEARALFLGIMQDQTERMERLVTDLLSLRKIESSEHITPTSSADLREALETARAVLLPLAERKNVILNVKLPEKPEALIFGKTDECVQLALNLIENAIKLSSKGNTVDVSLDYLPTWTGEAFPPPARKGAVLRRIVNRPPSPSPVWRIIISDSGPGFSRAHLPRIGERFYRVAGDLPAQEKGTGLGLAIVKHVTMRHHAGLFVQSAHRDDALRFGPETSQKIREFGTTFSVVFTAIDKKV